MNNLSSRCVQYYLEDVCDKKMIENFIEKDENEDEIDIEEITTIVHKYFSYIKKGDVLHLCRDRYRNDGTYIYTGKKISLLDFNVDEYGSVPSEYLVNKEYPPKYWSNAICHNNYVWINTKDINIDTFKYIGSCINENKNIFSVNIYDYTLFLSLNDEMIELDVVTYFNFNDNICCEYELLYFEDDFNQIENNNKIIDLSSDKANYLYYVIK
jgi:hypothetical protein